MSEEIKEECPKCDRPATTHRWKAGEKNWICGNGHNWTSAESKAKRDAANSERVNTPSPPKASGPIDSRRWNYKP